MKAVVVALVAFAATPSLAQDVAPDFYAGVLAGTGPSFTRDAQFWDDANFVVSPGIFAGADFVSGSMLFGIEGSLTSDIGRLNIFESQFASEPFFPRQTEFRSPQGPIGTFASTRPGGQGRFAQTNYTFTEVLARPMIAARVGVAIDDFTIYGRAGLGFAFRRTTSVTDRTITNCTETAIETRTTAFSTQVFETGCIGPQDTRTIDTTSEQAWEPQLALAVGADYDLGPYFVRGEVELVHSPTFEFESAASVVKANIGFGVRF